MDLLASNLVWFLLYGLTKIAPIISVYLLFTFQWPVLYLSLHIFFFVSSITLLLKDREKSHSLPPSKRSYRQELNWNFNSNLFIIPSVNIVDAITNRSYMTLNAKRIPIKQWSPIKQRTHKQYQRALPSQSWFKIILYCIFLLLLLFNTNPMYSATITYIPPETNHILTQEASLDLPGQHNIFTNLHQEHHPPSSFWRQFSLLKKVVQPNITVGTKNATLHFATLHQEILPTAILIPVTLLLTYVRHRISS